ncbi:MAG: DUF642 domain-containing protein [Microcoleaceae cyanobacterium]
MTKIVAWMISAVLAFSCLIISAPEVLAITTAQNISISDPIESGGGWIGAARFYSGYGCSTTAGNKTMGMNNLGISGKEFITLNQELIPGEYTATIDVCDYTNYPYTPVGKVGMTAGGILLTPISSVRPTPKPGETISWSFKYSVAESDPNLGSKIGFEINVPRGGTPVGNVAFDNLEIKTDIPPVALCENTAEKNLALNGSFEKPVVSYYSVEPSIEDWDLSQGKNIEINQYINNPYDGLQLVDLDSNNSTTKISQTIATEVGKTYKLTFAFKASDNPAAVEHDKLNVHWGNELVAELDKIDSDTAWEEKTYNLEAKSTETILSFDNLNETANSYGTRLDAVSLNLCQ